MTSEEHDRFAAESQGLTHFIGRTLDDFGLKPTPIDTLGAEKLSEVTDQVRHDTWQLFLDLQRYNPYTKDVRKNLRSSFEKTYDAILPQKTQEETVVIGIQGGVGSFNEEAVATLCRKK
jgi:prephenate dehydrogenase